tara:strand:+ start:1444 stop:2982 length:1539 start_codon:yes stop_codon:yes gene_type:complete
MISIDFGNSYTKVAVRQDVNSLTLPLRDSHFGELHVCIRTDVLQESSGNFKYGTDVRDQVLPNSGDRVFRNWKPQLFMPKSDAPVTTPTMENESDYKVSLITTLNLNEQQTKTLIGHSSNKPVGSNDYKLELINLLDLNKEQFQSLLTPNVTTTDSGSETSAQNLFTGYFNWLLNYIPGPCWKLGISDSELAEMPVRITAPSFGSQSNAEKLLVELMTQAGWSMDNTNSVIGEPIANAIGLLTENRNPESTGNSRDGCKNSWWTPERQDGQPHWGNMMGDTALFQEFRHFHQQDEPGDRYYWWLVVDIGGFTTDCSIIAFDLENAGEPIEMSGADQQGRRFFDTISHRHGVSNLDQSMIDALPKDQSVKLSSLIDGADQIGLSRLHRVLYSELRPYVFGDVTFDSLTTVKEQLDNFSERVITVVNGFLDRGSYDQVHALTLTGGGMNMQQVMTSVATSLLSADRFRGIRQIMCPNSHNLASYHGKQLEISQIMNRAATALGGASVIFDAETW